LSCEIYIAYLVPFISGEHALSWGPGFLISVVESSWHFCAVWRPCGWHRL